MHPILTAFLLGFIFSAVIFLGVPALCSRNTTGPDPERRVRMNCRRKRPKTANRITMIAEQYSAGALTYAQAVTRMREIEVPSDVIARTLDNAAITHGVAA